MTEVALTVRWRVHCHASTSTIDRWNIPLRPRNAGRCLRFSSGTADNRVAGNQLTIGGSWEHPSTTPSTVRSSSSDLIGIGLTLRWLGSRIE